MKAKKCKPLSKKSMAAMAAMLALLMAGAVMSGHMMGKKAGFVKGCSSASALFLGMMTGQQIDEKLLNDACEELRASSK